MHMAKRLAAGSVWVFAVLLLGIGLVSAHEGREVGEYELVFGWRVEPALTGYLNGPEVFIRHHEDGSPIESVDVSLQVEVTFGPASRTLELRPAFGEAGHYIADLIPTRPGDYTFRVFGAIGDMTVDETFSSADGEFSSVEPAQDIMFPEPDPLIRDLLARIEALEAELATLKGEGGTGY